MTEADDAMLKRKPRASLLWPDYDEVPEGVLAPRRRKAPPVLPYVKVGKGIYGRHTAVEVGVKGGF